MKSHPLILLAAVALAGHLVRADPQPVRFDAAEASKDDSPAPAKVSDDFFKLPNEQQRSDDAPAATAKDTPADGSDAVPTKGDDGDAVAKTRKHKKNKKKRSVSLLEELGLDEDDAARLRRKIRARIRRLRRKANKKGRKGGRRGRRGRRGGKKTTSLTIRGADGEKLSCKCKPAVGLKKNKSKAGKGRRIPKSLRGFCNKLVYVNGKPSFTNPRTRLLPYVKPKFNAVAKKRRGGAVAIERSGKATNLPNGSLHKYGFQTARGVRVPRGAKVVRFYAQVRFTRKPATTDAEKQARCKVKNAAVSFYYGAKRVGGRVYKGAKLPFGKWIPITATARRSALPKGGPQRITLQAAHNYRNDGECDDTVRFEVRRILACANTRATLFSTSAGYDADHAAQYSVADSGYDYSDDAYYGNGYGYGYPQQQYSVAEEYDDHAATDAYYGYDQPQYSVADEYDDHAATDAYYGYDQQQYSASDEYDDHATEASFAPLDGPAFEEASHDDWEITQFSHDDSSEPGLHDDHGFSYDEHADEINDDLYESGYASFLESIEDSLEDGFNYGNYPAQYSSHDDVEEAEF